MKLVIDNTKNRKSCYQESPPSNTTNKKLDPKVASARALLARASLLLVNAGTEYSSVANIIDDCVEMITVGVEEPTASYPFEAEG